MELHGREKVGVLLVNTGTPSAPEPKAVKRYLAQFLMDKHIAPMNRFIWWFILHLAILPKRSVASAEKYRKIWTPEGSPLLVTHKALAAALEARLESEGFDAPVRIAMSYGEPPIKKALREFRELECDRIVVLPMYPQTAHSTTLSVKEGVARAVRRTRFKGLTTVVEGYAEHPSYIRALAASIEHAGFGQQPGDRLVFSFHSIPLVDIEDGDTYELQTGSTSLHVADELGLDRKTWTISYHCRFDNARAWLSPFTKDTLARLAEVDDGRTFVVCPGFSADCLETRFDVEIEFGELYRDNLRAAGHPVDDSRFVYVPCLNRSRAHVRALCDVLKPYLGEGD